MSQNLRNFTKALYVLRGVAERVPADAWDSQSCCTDWTAREVAGHASWVIRNIGANVAGVEGPAQQPEADVAGDDPAATIRDACEFTLEALDHQGSLQKVVTTPFGEMPAEQFIGAVWIDPLSHAWDIADAVGIDHGIDDDTANAAIDTLTPVAPMLQGAGVLGPSIERDGDPADRFAALGGRSSVR